MKNQRGPKETQESCVSEYLAGPAHAADDAGFPGQAGGEVDVGPVHALQPLLANAGGATTVSDCDDNVRQR